MIDHHGVFLLIAALSAVIALILLIAVVKLNPFIVLFLTSLALAIVAGMPVAGDRAVVRGRAGQYARAHRHRGGAGHDARQDDGRVGRRGPHRVSR